LIALRRAGSALLLLLLLSGGARAESRAGDRPESGSSSTFDDSTDWPVVLRHHADLALQARWEMRQGQVALDEGRRGEAREHLERAVELDRGLEAAWFALARLHLREADPLFLTSWIAGVRAVLQHQSAQSLLLAQVLLRIDLVVGLALLWIMAVLLLRYLPFLQHHLRARLDRHGHTEGRGWILWPAVLAPFCLGLGLVPVLCLGLLVIWLYAGRRERVLLGLLAGFFVVQGLAGGLFGTVLVGLDPTSEARLVERAWREKPSAGLIAQLGSAMERDPQDPELHLARGVVEARRGRFDASATLFQETLRLRPGDPRATNNLANDHYYRHDYDRAVAGYQQSATQDSTQGSTHYNLAQAYIKKLFFKEGGEYMQRASRHGFQLETDAARLPAGAVYYQAAGPERSWRLAFHERGRIAPLDLLARWQPVLGVPADHLAWWLLAALTASALASRLWRRDRLVFECGNCGRLACPACSGHHDGSMLCSGCHATAQRARSEVVLSTLLRNRRRSTESAFHTRVQRLNAWAFGAGELYNGTRRRGVVLALLLAVLGSTALAPQPLLRGLWEAPSSHVTFPAARIVALVGLLLLFIIARFGRSVWRSRNFHLHPSSVVRLADLVEGRTERKLKA